MIGFLLGLWLGLSVGVVAGAVFVANRPLNVQERADAAEEENCVRSLLHHHPELREQVGL